MARRNTVLFVGDLSSICTEAHIRELFEVNGFNVIELKMMGGKVASNSYDYGFVELATPEEAEVALASLDGTFLCGRRLRVKWAAPNIKNKPTKGIINSIHVRFQALVPGMIVTEETLLSVFEMFGAISDVSVKSCALNPATGLHDGYGFVHFPCTPEGVAVALKAVSTLSETPIVDDVHYSCEMSKNLLRLLQVQSQKRQEMSMVHSFASAGYSPYPVPQMPPRAGPASIFSQGYVGGSRHQTGYSGLSSHGLPTAGQTYGLHQQQQQYQIQQQGQAPFGTSLHSSSGLGGGQGGYQGYKPTHQQTMIQHHQQMGHMRPRPAVNMSGLGLSAHAPQYRPAESLGIGDQEYDLNQLLGQPSSVSPRVAYTQSGIRSKTYGMNDSVSYGSAGVAPAANYPPWVAASATSKSVHEIDGASIQRTANTSLTSASLAGLAPSSMTLSTASGVGLSGSVAVGSGILPPPPGVSAPTTAAGQSFAARSAMPGSIPYYQSHTRSLSPSGSSVSGSLRSGQEDLSVGQHLSSEDQLGLPKPVAKPHSYGFDIVDFDTEQGMSQGNGDNSSSSSAEQSIEELTDLIQSMGAPPGHRMF